MPVQLINQADRLIELRSIPRYFTFLLLLAFRLDSGIGPLIRIPYGSELQIKIDNDLKDAGTSVRIFEQLFTSNV